MTAPDSLTEEVQSLRRALRDRYSIEKLLGRGGMGAVYLARDLSLDRHVALKVLPEEFASQASLRDRFLQETRTAASFSHPNIVPVYSVEEGAGLLAYTMGYIEGETLTERVMRAGPLSVREMVRVLQDVGYALAYAHGRRVVHRDVKPDNIMIERATGRALVMDFGISRSITQAMPGAALTRVGEVVGTSEYMSPEQAAGDVVDGRSDLYSLGLVAHFALTGYTAVTADSTQKVLVKQLTERAPPIASRRPDLPPALSGAIDRCVEKDPASRFATAEALVEAIDAAQLAAPEIPLRIRLFAADVSVLSLVTAGALVYVWIFSTNSHLGALDTLLPVVLLFSVLLTRALATLGEARRLAVAGFSVDDVMTGFAAVVAERAERRTELRGDVQTTRNRRLSLMWAVILLGTSIIMAAVAFSLRRRISPTRFSSPLSGVLLIFAATILAGISVALLFKSPFRMPIGERLFRIVWLGPFGRAFVRLGARRVKARPATLRLPSQPRTTVPPPASLPPSSLSPPPSPDRLGALEQRVAALEAWRDKHQ